MIIKCQTILQYHFKISISSDSSDSSDLMSCARKVLSSFRISFLTVQLSSSKLLVLVAIVLSSTVFSSKIATKSVFEIYILVYSCLNFEMISGINSDLVHRRLRLLFRTILLPFPDMLCQYPLAKTCE